MEELKKLKASMQALFSGEKAEDIKWKEKGKARTLGSADEAAKPRLSAAAQQPERPPVPSHAARPAVPAQPMQSPEERASRQRASSRASGPAGPPPPLSTVGSMRADEPQRGLLSGVVMANTPTGRERRGLGSHLSVGVVPAGMDSSNNSMGAAGQAVHCRPGDTGWATASTASTARHSTARHNTAQHLSEDAGPHAALMVADR
ncbi:hypothetical protein V8C86DRAFT_907402 [Haematococcus lacustris]